MHIFATGALLLALAPSSEFDRDRSNSGELHSPVPGARPVDYGPRLGQVVAYDGQLLSGWVAVDSLIIPAGCTVVADADLLLVARETIRIDGLLVGGAPRGGDGRGTAIGLRAGRVIEVTGQVLAGNGAQADVLGQGGDGGDLWLMAPSVVVDGVLHGGRGADGRAGGRGGHGGAVIVTGRTSASDRASTASPALAIGGDGGVGGAGRSAPVRVSADGLPTAGPGGSGGDGGPVLLGTDCERIAALSVDLRRVFQLDVPNLPPRLSMATIAEGLCDGYSGDWGSDGSNKAVPSGVNTDPAQADDCSFGRDGDNGVNATAGHAGDGGPGGDAICMWGNGGLGGNGGEGGAALNSITRAESGQSAGHCCDDDDGGPGNGQYGGRGGTGGNAKAGNGGKGGDGGLAVPGPWFGLKNGRGGDGGDSGTALAQDGGHGGDGGDGLTVGTPGQKGGGGDAVGGLPGLPGAPGGGVGESGDGGLVGPAGDGIDGFDGAPGNPCPTPIG